jgi:hypothetical protein
LVITEPWASRTADETMFSEAISSISSRWRPSSSSIARAISGSAAASGAEKNEFERIRAHCHGVPLRAVRESS